MMEPLERDRAEALARYVELLTTSGIERGLIGPREVPRIWDRHVWNCLAVEELIPRGVSVADVGSGAGLPGLVVAVARPDLRVVLIEPLLRRTTWLHEVVTELGVENVEVWRGRAEAYPGTPVEVATARAVAALPTLWEWTSGLLVPGGKLLAIKGESAEHELADAEGRLPGSAGAEVLTCGQDPTRPTRVIAVTAGSERERSARGARGSGSPADMDGRPAAASRRRSTTGSRRAGGARRRSG